MAGFQQIVGGLSALFIIYFAAAALFPLALAYVALRVRDARNPAPDPSLGAKSAYHLIHSLGILIALGGLTISAIDFMSGTVAPKVAAPQPAFPGRPAPPPPKEEGFNTAQRTAAALAGAGTFFALVFFGFLLATNDRKLRAVKRVFVGGRLTLSLLIALFTVVGLTVVLVQKEPNHEFTESFLAILIVWLPAAAIHFYLFQLATSESKVGAPNKEEPEWRPAE